MGRGAAAALARSRSRWARGPAVVVALGLAFLLFELASFARSGPPRRFNDSNGYLRVSQAPLLSREFLTGTRPIAVPLLYKALGQREAAIVRAQSLLSVGCWLALAVTFAGALRSRATRVLGALAVCAFSLSVPINQWDWVLLSEGPSLSLFAAVAALSLRLALVARRGRTPGPWLVAGWGACCLLFALTRDVHVYVLACGWGLLAVLSLLAVLRRRPWCGGGRWLIACLVVLSGTLAAAQLLSTASGRWKLPFLNVLLRRVLTDPALATTFAERYGMPRSSELERYAGRMGWQRAGRGEPMVLRMYFQDDPALADVRAWILDRGVASYARYLLVDHPVRAFRAAAGAFSKHAAQAFPNRRYGKGAGSTGWSRALSEVLHPRLPYPLAAWTLLLLGAGVLALRSPADRIAATAMLLLAMTAAVHAFVSFHGDASNVDRHIAYSGVALRLGWLLLLLVLTDLAVAAAGERLRGAPEGARDPGEPA